jgi:hypothetical protein
MRCSSHTESYTGASSATPHQRPHRTIQPSAPSHRTIHRPQSTPHNQRRIPGVGITGEQTTLAAIVLNVIFAYGVFVFAILLGTIADEVKNQMKTLRSGRKPLKLAGHTLILNWNQKLIPLLRQISAAKAHGADAMWHRPVVVLADKTMPEASTAPFPLSLFPHL